MSPCFRTAVAALAAAFFAAALLAAPASQAQAVASIRRVQVLHGGAQTEIEIESTAPIVPQTNELTGPYRLLVDFVKATPGAGLRGQAVNRGEVKDLRVGLFSADPPVTRIVVDLNGPQPYQVFPSGRTTIVKIGAAGGEVAQTRSAIEPLSQGSDPAQPGTVSEPQSAPVQPAKPSFEVSFQNGLLSIVSDKATLSEILFAVHQRTGAEIAIPAGAEQEKVAVALGPAPAPEVLSQLLNGSKFNFLILSSASDPHALDQVILTPRTEGAMPVQSPPPPPVQQRAEEEDNDPRTNPRGRPGPPPPIENPTTDDQGQPVPPPPDSPQ
jgi:AMIN domain